MLDLSYELLQLSQIVFHGSLYLHIKSEFFQSHHWPLRPPCRNARRNTVQTYFVEVPPRAVKLVDGQRGDHDPGENGVDPRPLRAPLGRLFHNALFAAPPGQLACVQGIADVLRLKLRQFQQFQSCFQIFLIKYKKALKRYRFSAFLHFLVETTELESVTFRV